MAKLKKTPTEIKYEALCRKLSMPLKRKQERDKKKRKIQPTIVELRNMPYKEFLKTDYWQKVRKRILKRDGNKCVVCKSNKRLQVHHDSYNHHGNELKHLYELITLCYNCHKEHHYAQK